MPIPSKILEEVSTATDLLEQGERSEAAQVLERVYRQVERILLGLTAFEAMEMLGILAHGFRQLSQTAKEIRALERLCSIAERDLAERGIFATDDDIRFTGMDFVYLGLAYNKRGQSDEARIALNKAKEILEEIDWEVDVDKILAGHRTRIGPKQT